MDPKEYRLAAIMFTDIVGFSRMMEQNEKATLELLEYHNEIVRKHSEEMRGSIIKTIGDAFLIDFPNTVNAVNCAVRIQKDLEQHNIGAPELPLVLRIGVHLGDIYFYENDALGEGINIASRLQSICNPGRICISQDVYNLVNNKIEETPIVEIGEVKLKNISRKIHAYEILTNGKGEKSENKSKGSTSSETDSTANLHSSGSSAPGGNTTPADTIEFKRLMMEEIKKAGRRLTADEVRHRLGISGVAFDNFLTEMEDRGFLAPRATGGAQQSPRPGEGDYSGQFRRAASEFGKVGLEIAHEIGREFERGRSRTRNERSVRRGSRRFDVPEAAPSMPVPSRRGYGHDDRKDRAIERAWDKVLDTPYQDYQDQQLIQEYRAQTMKSLSRAEAGFRSHFGTYLAVNIGLTAIWAFSGAGFPWFFFPAAGWGIGMFTHWSTVRRKRLEAKELQALPALNKPQLKKIRKLNRIRSAFSGHFVSNFATALFLGGINLLTSPTVPWSLIPIAGMAIGVFSHLPNSKRKEQEVLEDLQSMGVPVKALRGAKNLKLAKTNRVPTEGMNPVEAEALNLKNAILAQTGGMKNVEALGENFQETLDEYITQIISLSRKDRDITGTLSSIPMANMERELLDLESQYEKAGNPDLKIELEKSIDSVKKQRASYFELQNQQQLLKAKMGNALNSLRQLQIDLVKMKDTPELGELPPLEHLRNQTGEISHYLNDLEGEYRRLESMEEELGG